MNATCNATQATVSNLTPNTLYTIQVAAVNSVSKGAYSNPIEGMYTIQYSSTVLALSISTKVTSLLYLNFRVHLTIKLQNNL